jgi:uncharacterized RmlC-like cupin family protein
MAMTEYRKGIRQFFNVVGKKKIWIDFAFHKPDAHTTAHSHAIHTKGPHLKGSDGEKRSKSGQR